ncbi:MAG: DUF2304 domain-containing protein [Coriobacteriia bacterium]|nr:DUF2304 domain-containing protein [Coriobacteriia bacterium]
MLIKFLLVGVFLAILIYVLRAGRTTLASAGKRILLILFVLAAILAVLFPDELTVFANFLGVGRGADLLLYATVAGLVVALLAVYARFKDVEEKLATLARSMAILESRLAEATSSTRDDSHAPGDADE